jgi:hypothetical protein
LKLLTNLENSSSNSLQKPKSGDFDTENAYRKPPVTSLLLHIFLAANEAGTREHGPTTEKGILRRVLVSI